MGDLVNAGLDLVGIGPASKQADATTDAAKTAAAASRYAIDKQIEMQEPWRKAGEGALNQLIPLASNYTPFGMNEFKADPGYAFRLSEGLKGLDRQAAARGGLISGSALKAAQRYGQEMGSQEYTNAFNRYQTERNARLNPLQSLAGVGQTSATTLGNNLSNIAMQSGDTQANALLTQGNIRASQYGTLGRGIDQAMNTNWSKVGNWFGGSSPTTGGWENYGASEATGFNW